VGDGIGGYEGGHGDIFAACFDVPCKGEDGG